MKPCTLLNSEAGPLLDDFTKALAPSTRVQKKRGQVLTRPAPAPAQQTLSVQGIDASPQAEESRSPSLCVRHKPPRKGGWKGSTCLLWNDVKRIAALAHAARKAGVALNVFVTIRAPRGVSDAEGKRIISRAVAHLGQGLTRRGQKHVGLTVYEKAPDLHGHHLVHIRPGNGDVVARWAAREERDARHADRGAVEYITKQRQWLGPEFEKSIKRRWEPSARIEGPRWTSTGAARALIAGIQAAAVPPAEPPAVAAPILQPKELLHAA